LHVACLAILTMKMEAGYPSETSMNMYLTARRDMSEDNALRTQRYVNFKCGIVS
jgi:hypothetical protein